MHLTWHNFGSENQQQHKAPITIDTTRTTTGSWDPNAVSPGEIATTHSEQQQQPVRHRNSETVTPTFTNFSPVSADTSPTFPTDRRMSAEWGMFSLCFPLLTFHASEPAEVDVG